MRKIRRIKDRAGYTPGHFSQLATSHDFFNDAWGKLDQLGDEQLQTTVADMVACWRQHQADVEAECRPGTPWFSRYAADPQRLIAESLKHRAYMQYQRDHNGYRPYREFEAQYQPPPPVAPPAVG